MCATCGCGDGETRIDGKPVGHDHQHHHGGHHHHDHGHALLAEPGLATSGHSHGPHDHHHHLYPHADHPLGPRTLPKVPGALARRERERRK